MKVHRSECFSQFGDRLIDQAASRIENINFLPGIPIAFEYIGCSRTRFGREAAEHGIEYLPGRSFRIGMTIG